MTAHGPVGTYYYVQWRPTDRTAPMTVAPGTGSEWFRREARLARALGDEATARKWDRQAETEAAYERGEGVTA